MHAFDWLVWRRCLGLSLLLSLLTAGVAAATDEAGSTLGTRLARLAAFLPAVVVIAQALVLAQSRERGEIGALAALGASPFRRVRGAILAGLCLGALAVLSLLSPWSDVSALFPVVGSATSFTVVGSGLEDPATGALYSPDGSICFGVASEPASSGLAAPSRAAGLGFVAPLMGAASVWGAAPMGALMRVAAAGVTFVVSVVLLHAVAKGRMPAAIMVLAAAPMALHAMAAYRRAAS